MDGPASRGDEIRFLMIGAMVCLSAYVRVVQDGLWIGLLFLQRLAADEVES